MERDNFLDRVGERTQPFDVIVIGGGATGAGIALDAASRGLDVILLERSDFANETSSRSTKIIHGGVRYMAQARFGLVREALQERALLLRNAPHLVRPLPFIVPAENYLEQVKYLCGLKLYDLLAGTACLEQSTWLPRAQVIVAAPCLEHSRVRGGIRYVDAQFDDARLVISIIRTAAGLGATVLNYCEVTSLDKASNGRIRGVGFVDRETQKTYEIAGHTVINATGPYSNAVMQLDCAGSPPRITPSQGAHLVVATKFLPGNNALLMPHTPDKRIMFAIPWYGHVLLGTTDIPLDEATYGPVPQEQEIDMILEVSRRYLARAPGRADILSCFAGIRPLALTPGNSVTAKVSREHHIDASRSGLITISGGKWTTYRRMAEECVDFAVARTGLPVSASRTRDLPLHGATAHTQIELPQYGTDATPIKSMIRDHPQLGDRIHPALPYIGAECIWAVRHEMARTVEDVLARRLRALFLNAEAARAMVPSVAALVRTELKRDDSWERQQIDSCEQVALKYRLAGARPHDDRIPPPRDPRSAPGSS